MVKFSGVYGWCWVRWISSGSKFVVSVVRFNGNSRVMYCFYD